MVATDTITVDVVARVKCTHKVLYSHSSFYKENLQGACAEAEKTGMALMSVVDAGQGYSVLVFIGDEEVDGDEADDPT